MKWFVSYARRDSMGEIRPTVEFVAADFVPLLRYALDQLGGGEVYADSMDDRSPEAKRRILTQLRGADGVIALVDFQYLKSDWCLFEFEVGVHLFANRRAALPLLLLPLTSVNDVLSRLDSRWPCVSALDPAPILHEVLEVHGFRVLPVYAGKTPARPALATRIYEWAEKHLLSGDPPERVTWPAELEAKATAMLTRRTK